MLNARGEGLVSIYLPTTPVTPEAEGDRIAFRNLARRAVEELRGRGLGAGEVDEVEAKLEDLHDDEEFWTVLAHSLAVFAELDGLRTFRLPNRLTESVHVADRFYVKPLLRAVLAGQTVPLILAAAQPIDAIFRSVNSYPHLAAPTIEGSPEGRTDAELGEAARAVFVDIDASVPGTVDEESGAVALDDGAGGDDYGVIDELARRVLLADGTVLAVRADEVPGGGPAAAILRYPV